MAIAHVGDFIAQTETSPSASLQQSVQYMPMAGSSLVMAVYYESASTAPSVTSVTDNGGFTWTKVKSIVNGIDACDIWKADNVPGAFSQPTVHVSPNCYISFNIAEFSVTSNALSIDSGGAAFSTNTGNGLSNPASTGAFSTTTDNALLIAATAMAAGIAGITDPAGFTRVASGIGGTGENGTAAWKIVSVTQSGINPTWNRPTANANWAAIGLALVEGGATPSPSPSPSPSAAASVSSSRAASPSSQAPSSSKAASPSSSTTASPSPSAAVSSSTPASPSPSAAASSSLLPSLSPSALASPSATVSPGRSPSPSVSLSPSPSASPSVPSPTWLCPWLYREAITIDNTQGTFNLNYYPLALTLSAANFNFAHAKADLSDLRFTAADGLTLLNYWVEYIDTVNSLAYVVVQVQNVAAGAFGYVFMYYGNSGAFASSNAVATVNSNPSGAPPSGTPQAAQVIETSPDGHTSASVSCELPDGSWLVLYGTLTLADSPPYQHTRVCKSTDRGTTWSCSNLQVSGTPTVPVFPATTNAKAVPSAIGVLASGTILVWLNTNDGTSPGDDSYIIKSTDNGVTWQSVQKVTSPYPGAGNYFFEAGGYFVETTPGGKIWGTAVIQNTGSTYSTCVIYEAANEASAFALRGGSVASASISGAENTNPGSQFGTLCRIDGNTYVACHYTGHTGIGNPIYLSRTTDGGATWSFAPMIDPGNLNSAATYNGEAPHVQRLANGNLVIWSTDRGHKTVSAYISRDNGLHWEYRTDIIDTSAMADVNQSESFAFTVLRDQTLLACYVYGVGTGADDCYWTTFGQEYLLAEMYDDFESGVGNWTAVTGTPVQDTAHSVSPTHSMKLLQAPGDGACAAARSFIDLRPDRDNASARRRSLSCWEFLGPQVDGSVLMAAVTGTAYITPRLFEVFATSAHQVQYLDSAGNLHPFNPPVTAPVGSWFKITLAYDQVAGTGKVYLNNVLAGTIGLGSITTTAGILDMRMDAGDNASTSTGTTMWADDAWSSQWLDVLPPLAFGFEQNAPSYCFGSSSASASSLSSRLASSSGFSVSPSGVTSPSAQPSPSPSASVQVSSSHVASPSPSPAASSPSPLPSPSLVSVSPVSASPQPSPSASAFISPSPSPQPSPPVFFGVTIVDYVDYAYGIVDVTHYP